MKKLNSVKAMFTIAMFTIMTMLFVAASSSVAQVSRGGKVTPQKRSRMAVVAVAKDNRLVLAGEKARVMRSIKRAIEKVNAQEVLKDIDIRSSEKADYLAVSLEDRRRNTSTLFIQLEPAGGSTDYRQPGPHVVTCINVNVCGIHCVATPTTNTSLASCFCNIPGSEANNTKQCTFKINKVYIRDLVLHLNAALLADGFEEAGESTTTEGPPKDKTPVLVRPRPGKN